MVGCIQWVHEVYAKFGAAKDLGYSIVYIAKCITLRKGTDRLKTKSQRILFARKHKHRYYKCPLDEVNFVKMP